MHSPTTLVREHTWPTLLQHCTDPVLQTSPPVGAEAGAVTVTVVVTGGGAPPGMAAARRDIARVK